MVLNPLRALCEKWDGSSWTEVGDLNTARAYQQGGCGTNTAALCIGGNSPQIDNVGHRQCKGNCKPIDVGFAGRAVDFGDKGFF